MELKVREDAVTVKTMNERRFSYIAAEIHIAAAVVRPAVNFWISVPLP
jgi:hypothetical protein